MRWNFYYARWRKPQHVLHEEILKMKCEKSLTRCVLPVGHEKCILWIIHALHLTELFMNYSVKFNELFSSVYLRLLSRTATVFVHIALQQRNVKLLQKILSVWFLSLDSCLMPNDICFILISINYPSEYLKNSANFKWIIQYYSAQFNSVNWTFASL